MPDFKFWARESARSLLKARDYPLRARQAIAEMHRQVGDLRFDHAGLAVRGLLVRHLVMPGREAEAAAIFEWLATAISPDSYVNIMAQYRPCYEVAGEGPGARPGKYSDIARRPHRAELAAAYRAARAAGLWRFDERGP